MAGVECYGELYVKFKNSHTRLVQSIGQEAFARDVWSRLPIVLTDVSVKEIARGYGWSDEWLKKPPSRKSGGPPPASRDIQRMFVGGQPSQGVAAPSSQQQPEQVSQVMAKSPPRPLMNLSGQTPSRPMASVDARSVPGTPMTLAGPPPPPAARHGQGQNRPGPAAVPAAVPMTPALRSKAAPPSPPDDFMRRLEDEFEAVNAPPPLMNGGHAEEGHNGGEGHGEVHGHGGGSHEGHGHEAPEAHVPNDDGEGEGEANDNNVCVICMQEFGDLELKTLQCGHVLHQVCHDDWRRVANVTFDACPNKCHLSNMVNRAPADDQQPGPPRVPPPPPAAEQQEDALM